jgi:large subunit ribosomal protein L17
MKHLKNFKVLNRTHAHRKALYRNMVTALFQNERICTTKTKAMEIRRIAEKIITKAKEKNLHNIRLISRMIQDKKILMKLFDEIAPRYLTRKGGYTRVYKLARRKGDGSNMAYLTLIEDEIEKKKKKKKKIKDKDNIISKKTDDTDIKSSDTSNNDQIKNNDQKNEENNQTENESENKL